jgi:hypothetical protein
MGGSRRGLRFYPQHGPVFGGSYVKCLCVVYGAVGGGLMAMRGFKYELEPHTHPLLLTAIAFVPYDPDGGQQNPEK